MVIGTFGKTSKYYENDCGYTDFLTRSTFINVFERGPIMLITFLEILYLIFTFAHFYTVFESQKHLFYIVVHIMIVHLLD